MARGRKTALTIRLAADERHTLMAWQRSTTIPAGRARRGRIILLVADGVPISHIADTVGISVRAVRWSAVLAGGVLGGLGGSFFTLASTGSFTKEFTVGNGFIALAALIMGRWHPVLATMMCLFFGFVTQMASQLQTLNTPMPSQFLLILPYVATIIAVAGLVGRVRAGLGGCVPQVPVASR